jgi:hypothetical protein
MALRPIEIDWDIYKAIEVERRDFDEPQFLALRRLLGLPEQKADPNQIAEARIEKELSVGRSWYEDGVQVPHGSDARMRYDYNRQIYEGKFLDGRLVVNGKSYDSLSRAANSLARTKAGSKTQLNGWKYWEVRLPGKNNWERLEDLRDQARNDLSGKISFDL